MGIGRASKYSEELTDEICCRIADGESLRRICEDEGMPHRDTVRKWLGEREEFSGQYARARDEQADYYADEIIEIADSSGDDVALGRLKMDARKWVASKLKPKKYGERLTNEITGKDGGPLEVQFTDVLREINERKRATDTSG